MQYENISHILEQVIAEQLSDDTLSFMLVGSYARGNANAHSDIDLTHFVHGQEASSTDYAVKENRLISILTTTLPKLDTLFIHPQQAIYALPMWRTAKILQDKSGDIQLRQQHAQNFKWHQIQEAANQYASFALYKKAEEVMSLMGAIQRKDIWAATTHRSFLLNWLGMAMAVRYGIFINNESSLFPLIIEYLGHNTKWSQLAHSAIEAHPLQATSVIYLYGETVNLLADIILPEHRKLIAFALDKIDKSI